MRHLYLFLLIWSCSTSEVPNRTTELNHEVNKTDYAKVESLKKERTERKRQKMYHKQGSKQYKNTQHQDQTEKQKDRDRFGFY